MMTTMVMRDQLLLLMTPMVLQLLKNMELQLVMNMVPQLMKLLLNILLMPDVDVPDLETTDVQLKLKEQADSSDQHKTEDLSNNNVVLSLNNSQDVDVVEVLSPSQFLTEVH